MAGPISLVSSTSVTSKNPPCILNVTQYTDYGFPDDINTGKTIPTNTFSECAIAFGNPNSQGNGFIFNSTTTPSTCQAIEFQSIPGNSLFLYTPSGFVNLGAFGDDVFSTDGYLLQTVTVATANDCVSGCKTTNACVVAVFSNGGGCVLSTMKHTTIGRISNFYTGKQCDSVSAPSSTSTFSSPSDTFSMPFDSPTTSTSPIQTTDGDGTTGAAKNANNAGSLPGTAKFSTQVIVIGIIIGSVLIVFIATTVVLFRRKYQRAKRRNSSPELLQRRETANSNVFIEMSSRA
ncbi:hypothetical protein BC830DRAFT_1165624 [Chytriomyces sp. MP71]|nr:hypothetical protein BC830DRAFT_1165624 [Chytriomyces sp. MP71]